MKRGSQVCGTYTHTYIHTHTFTRPYKPQAPNAELKIAEHTYINTYTYKPQAPNAELKIADFGLAQLVKRGDKLMSGRGTPEYVAPEVIERTGYDSAADMWSVGVLVYTWMSGVFPFYAPDRDENREQISVVVSMGSYFVCVCNIHTCTCIDP